jgi:coenzyme F420-0:L-glutamate ligase / coenzyme F420-1:gamma-L-glutamate ligase
MRHKAIVGTPHAAPLRLIPAALRLVRSARVAHLATGDARGQPHVIPICFVFDGNDFYSPIDEKPKRTPPQKLKRIRNVLKNPQVSLVIDHYDEDWRKLSYVLVSGKARMLLSGAKHGKAVKLLRQKYSQYRKMRIDKLPVILIQPKRTTSWSAM